MATLVLTIPAAARKMIVSPEGPAQQPSVPDQPVPSCERMLVWRYPMQGLHSRSRLK